MTRYFTILIFLLLANACLAQEITLVFYRPLTNPPTNIYDLSAAGLVGIGNDLELQLWDSRTQAYYGAIEVIAPENTPIRIRKVSYSASRQELAILGEQVNYGPTHTTIFKDWLLVYDLHTLELVHPPIPNGAAELIRFEMPDTARLPALRDSAGIYDYFYQERSNRLYTADRLGKVSIYKGKNFEKELITHTTRSRILVAEKSDSTLWLADDDQAVLKAIKIKDGAPVDQIQLISAPACRNSDDRYRDSKNFHLSYIPATGELLILDSINRIRYFRLGTRAFTGGIDLEDLSPARLTSLNWNARDSVMHFIIENPNLSCQTSGGSLNRRNGIFEKYENPDFRLRKVLHAHVTDRAGKFNLFVSGYGEYETNLRSLQETPIHIFQDSLDFTTGAINWEHGYLLPISLGNNKVMIRVYRADSVTKFLYSQTIQLPDRDTLVGILPGKKWYLTMTRADYFQPDSTDLTVHDSTGKILFTTKGNFFSQTLLTPYSGQELFSNDGRHMLVREVLGKLAGMDLCRIRVYKTANFQLEAEIKYQECPDVNVFSHNNNIFSPDSKSFFFTARDDLGSGPITVLYQCALRDSTVSLIKAIPLCGDATCHLPFSIRMLHFSANDTSIYFTGMADWSQPGSAPVYKQVIGCVDLLSLTTRWRMNLSPKAPIYYVLDFDRYLALESADDLEFFTIDTGGPRQFLQITPVINTFSWEASNFYSSFESAYPVYYERTGNEDLLSARRSDYSLRRNFFDQALNRPDSILCRIPGSDVNALRQFTAAIQKREKRLPTNPADLDLDQLPGLKLVGTGYHHSKFAMLLSVHSPVPLEKISVIINGNKIIQFLDPADALAAANSRDSSADLSFSLDLTNGKNKIQISVIDKDARESLPVTITQNEGLWSQPKPELHALVVAVGNYKQRTPLFWSLKDGRDMADLFANHLDNTLFSHIRVDTLFDNQVTPARVQVWLDQQKQTSPGDCIIIFYNGHGFLDEKMDLLLTTPETELQPPYTHALHFESLLTAMDALPARQKLFLVDACNSGDRDKDNDKSTFQFLKKKFTFTQQGNGTFVYASSSGFDQSGQPDKDDPLQNDFFTAALKAALLDHAASRERHGRIFVGDLFRYVTPKTYQLSGRTQTPDLRTSNPDNNWQLK